MSKVFLIAQPSVSREGTFPKLDALGEHGEVHVLVVQGDSASFRPNKTLDDILRQLAELYNPAEDFVVWAGGDTLAAVLTGIALERRGINEMTWLRYDRPYNQELRKRVDEGAKYVPIKIQLYNPLTDDEPMNPKLLMKDIVKLNVEEGGKYEKVLQAMHEILDNSREEPAA
jgi:hypothetical protein